MNWYALVIVFISFNKNVSLGIECESSSNVNYDSEKIV